MGYIGNFPTALPLTSSDLPDDIVTSAKIADGTITATDTDGSIGKPAFKNLIINGDMSIAQRGTSKTGETGSGYKSLDRWRFNAGSGITSTFSQSTDVPSGQGFAYSFKQEATTGDADLSTDQYNVVIQRIEGQMLQHLKKGTSNAENTALSFWVKASVTGTYIVNITDDDNSRVIAKSYTINSANTWEKKTITFDGDTTGTLDNDNARSITINFWLGAGTDYTSGTLQTTWGSNVSANLAVGQVNAFASNNNTWQITGVQWEVGTSASDFEFLPYDVNLQRCQRYYQNYGSWRMWFTFIDGNTSDRIAGHMIFTTKMRTAPTATKSSSAIDSFDSFATYDVGIRSFGYRTNRGGTGFVDSITVDAEL